MFSIGDGRQQTCQPELIEFCGKQRACQPDFLAFSCEQRQRCQLDLLEFFPETKVSSERARVKVLLILEVLEGSSLVLQILVKMTSVRTDVFDDNDDR